MSSRLMTRFALGSLLAFLAVGITVSVVVSRELRNRQEDAARFHAQFVAESILRYELSASDVSAPLAVNGPRYRELVQFVRARILQSPVVRVKIWSRDGTIVFSDEPRLVGQRFAVDEELKEAFAGKSVGGVTNLRADENVFEQSLASKLYSTYTPLYIGTAAPRGTPAAVVEVYQDYARIQDEVNRLFGELILTLAIGLAALYVILVPIIRGAARTLSEQNMKLEQQAGRLEELLSNEKRTVGELRELNRLKDEFVAIASHEVRTPLTSIIGYAKTLRRPEFADDAAARNEFLGAIERQGDRLHRLVQNLLASSQVEDDLNRPSLTTFRFQDVVEEVLVGLGAGRPRIGFSVPPDLEPIVSDRQRVELILSNLLDNALKFSLGETACRLEAHREGDTLVFRVRDEGVGIPADKLPRIFDRFYQVDSSVTRQYGGVGLGLSLVKQLVSSLAGQIEVQSRPGRGSSFTVRLPAFRAIGDQSIGPDLAHAKTPVTSRAAP